MASQEGLRDLPHRTPAVQEARDTLRALAAEGSDAANVVRLEKLLQHEDAPVEVSYQLGLLYQRLGRFHEALARFEACFQAPEHVIGALAASAQCELDLDRPARATPLCDRALRHLAVDSSAAPSDVASVLRLALECAEAEGDVARAAEYRSRLADHAVSAPEVGTTEAPAGDLEGTDSTARPTSEPTNELPGAEAPGATSHDLAPTLSPGTGRLHMTYKRLFTSGDAGAEDAEPADVEPMLVASRWQPRAGGTSPFRPVTAFRRGRVPLDHVSGLAGDEQLAVDARALLAEATADLRAGHPVAAIDSCQALIIEAPDYLPAHLRLAESYAAYGHVSEALHKCQALLRLHETRRDPASTIPIYRLIGALSPDDLTAWTTMADHFFAQGGDRSYRSDVAAFVRRAERLGQAELALEYAERLATTAHDDVAVMRLAAELQLRRGTPARALPHYQVLLRQNADDLRAVAGANIALTCRDGALHWPSLERLAQYLPSAPDDVQLDTLKLYQRCGGSGSPVSADLYCAEGVLALARHDAVAAHGAFLAAHEVEAPASSPEVRFVIAYGMQQALSALDAGSDEREWIVRGLEMLRDPRLREFATQSALFADPISAAMLQIALAESFLLDGHDGEAVAVLDRAKAEFPDDAAIPRRLAALYTLQGNIGGALDELDTLARRQLADSQLQGMLETLGQMSSLAGDSVAVKQRLVGLYASRGFPREALGELNRIVTIHERAGRPVEAAEALRQSAELGGLIGDHEEASRSYERAVTLAPADTGLRQAYVNALLRAGRHTDAAGQQRAIAQLLWEAGQLPPAIAAFHQVLNLDPRDVESHHRLADALSSVGEYGEAERVYRRLLRLTPDDPVVAEKQAALAALTRA